MHWSSAAGPLRACFLSALCFVVAASSVPTAVAWADDEVETAELSDDFNALADVEASSDFNFEAPDDPNQADDPGQADDADSANDFNFGDADEGAAPSDVEVGGNAEIDAQAASAVDHETNPDVGEAMPGHSMLGDAFNEGPRQAAHLMPGAGKVSFPVTTKNPLVQRFVNQGIGQLHGFWYYEAERSFRQAAKLDAECAMAYWGMAMANTEKQIRAKEFIAEAVKRKAAATRREQMYIDALDAYYKAGGRRDKERRRAYVQALESIVQQFPDDIEAKAFLAVVVWQNRERGWPIPSYQAVEALIQQVLAVEPMHPVHHYRIHLWDSEKAAMALTSAAACGQSAPGIAHMWHMSGHIFSKLYRFTDAIWQQEASTRVDHAYMIENRILPDQIHNYAHNQEWMIRNLSNVGRAHDAIARAKDLSDLPRHPRFNTLSKGSANWGRMRLFEVLSRYELWGDLIELCHTSYLEPTDVTAEQTKRLRHLGSAYAQSGDLGGARRIAAELDVLLAASKAEQDAAGKKAADEARAAKDSGKEDIAEAEEDARETFAARVTSLEKAVAEIRGHLAVADGDFDAAFKHFEKAGNVSKEVVSRAHLAAGNSDLAVEFAEEALKSTKGQIYPLANYVDVLERAGRPKEAAAEFEKLRKMAGQLDLDLPIVRRIEPVARRLGYAGDWRVPLEQADDVGQRPEIESLGPITWHPFAAPSWSASDSSGRPFSSEQFRGRPMVVVLYLGFGCLHCVEQLKAFRESAAEFVDAGLPIVAIGTDTVEALAEASSSLAPNEAYPFAILSDADLHVFRLFGAFDDFEDRPLHATLLIDADGQICWQDIHYEPFTDAKFLLKESKRLLKLGESSGTPLTAQAKP